MFYTRYLRSFVSTFLICWIIFLLLVSFQIGFATSIPRAHHELYTLKSNIVNSIDERKLLIVSGSNSFYGISCKMVYEKTKFPCVNGGTTILEGIDYILYNARSWAKPGDTVLLPLEFLHYQYNGKPSQHIIQYTFAYDMNYFKQRDINTQISLVAGISLKNLFKNTLHRISKIGRTTSNEIPYKHHINKYGDSTENQETLDSLDGLKPYNIDAPLQYTEGMKSIEKFVEWCRINNINVLATWPNTLYFEKYDTAASQSFFNRIKEFYKSIEVPMLGNPKDFMYDKSLFYDAAYHLNTKGVRKRTQQLLDLLEPYLEEIKSN